MKKIIKIFASLSLMILSYSAVFSQATLTISTVNGTAGNPVTVPVTATGITDMVGFQFTIAYDQTKLTYVNSVNWGGGTNTSSNALLITPRADGKVTFVYNGDPVNISSGKFFDLNFMVNPGISGNAPVTWSDNPTPRELSNSIPEEISCMYKNGAVVISGSTSLSINFDAGWNIFSSNIIPVEPDIQVIFQPLINEGKLVKIQDENGNSLEDLGFFGGWTNNIGNMVLTEGYKIKVTTACQVSITGMQAPLPYAIPLKAGWNIMGYPKETASDGLDIVQQLIDRGVLVKVQDEKGNAIEDLGIFGGWQNFIGDFKPGKGYKIKVSANDILTVF